MLGRSSSRGGLRDGHAVWKGRGGRWAGCGRTEGRSGTLVDEFRGVRDGDTDGQLGECRCAAEMEEVGDGSSVRSEVGPVGELRSR